MYVIQYRQRGVKIVHRRFIRIGYKKDLFRFDYVQRKKFTLRKKKQVFVGACHKVRGRNVLYVKREKIYFEY